MTINEVLNKCNKTVIKDVIKSNKKILDFDNFVIEYLSSLIFIYVDTYGISKEMVNERLIQKITYKNIPYSQYLKMIGIKCQS